MRSVFKSVPATIAFMAAPLCGVAFAQDRPPSGLPVGSPSVIRERTGTEVMDRPNYADGQQNADTMDRVGGTQLQPVSLISNQSPYVNQPIVSSQPIMQMGTSTYAPPASNLGVQAVYGVPMQYIPSEVPVTVDPMMSFGCEPSDEYGFWDWIGERLFGPECIEDCVVDCGDCSKGVGLFGDYLYMSAGGVDVLFAQPVNGCSTLAVPTGPGGTISPQFHSGFRTGIMYLVGESGLLQGTYTYFESNSDERFDAPNGTIIRSPLTHPSTVNCDQSSLSAMASYEIDFQLADFDYKHTFFQYCGSTLSFLGGVRYGRLDQNFQADYTISSSTSVMTEISFDGVGPRIGLEGEMPTNCLGLLLYGRGTSSFLVGSFDADVTQDNTFAGRLVAANFSSDRIVPILELEVGVGWTNTANTIRVLAGYQVAGWLNTITTPGLIRGVQAGTLGGDNEDLKNVLQFNGLVARFEWRF